MLSPDESAALDLARSALLADCEGELQFSGQSAHIKFTIDNDTGRLITSLPVAALLAAEHVLFIPSETDDSLQLMISPEEIGESAATDRFQAFHGAPEHVRWATCWIDSARHGPWVFDGEAMMIPNALAADEPALCKLLNQDDAALAAVAQRHAGIVVPSPVCVGVDPRGLHIRVRFGVVRVPFPREAKDANDARSIIHEMMTNRR